MVNLKSEAGLGSDTNVRDASVLIIHGLTTGIDEYKQLVSQKWDTKYWDTRRGKVLNKHARENNMIAHFRQDADYENKKGTVIHFDDVPTIKSLLEDKIMLLGPKFKKLLVAECNKYPDGGTKKHGIGFHGDTERRIVVAIRCAMEYFDMPLIYRWYHHNTPIGTPVEISINTGDVYVMSEVAVGTDWRCSSIATLRHATGAPKYTNPPPKKKQKT